MDKKFAKKRDKAEAVAWSRICDVGHCNRPTVVVLHGVARCASCYLADLDRVGRSTPASRLVIERSRYQ